MTELAETSDVVGDGVDVVDVVDVVSDDVDIVDNAETPRKSVNKFQKILSNIKVGPREAQPRKRYNQSMFNKILPHDALDKFHNHEKETFSKTADATTYTIEIIFMIVMVLAFINLITSNKKAIISVHAIRAFILLLIVVLSIILIAMGYSVPDVKIYFYIIELLVIIGITTVTLVMQSIALYKKKYPNIKASADIISSSVPQSTTGDIIAIVVSSLLIVLNLYLLGVTGYRYYIGKRYTPLNTVITILTALAMAGTSIKSIFDAVKL